jgi:hypothetical protein
MNLSIIPLPGIAVVDLVLLERLSFGRLLVANLFSDSFRINFSKQVPELSVLGDKHILPETGKDQSVAECIFH